MWDLQLVLISSPAAAFCTSCRQDRTAWLRQEKRVLQQSRHENIWVWISNSRSLVDSVDLSKRQVGQHNICNVLLDELFLYTQLKDIQACLPSHSFCFESRISHSLPGQLKKHCLCIQFKHCKCEPLLEMCHLLQF